MICCPDNVCGIDWNITASMFTLMREHDTKCNDVFFIFYSFLSTMGLFGRRENISI